METRHQDSPDLTGAGSAETHTAHMQDSSESSSEQEPEPAEISDSPRSRVKYAKAAVRAVGPRVYVLTEHDSEEICIDAFGCQGEEGPHVKEVAELLEKKAAVKKPDLMIGLGDNIYNDGVESPDDQRFQTQVYDIYADKKLAHICDVPIFFILGNHDANRYAVGSYKSTTNYALSFFPGGTAIADKYLPNKPIGEEREINQVAHTYLRRPSDPIIGERYTQFFQRKEIPLSLLRKFNMPYYYYSIIIGNVQVFLLNSNNYPKHYLDMINGSNVDPLFNQAVWLKLNYNAARAAGRTVIFAQHHPLITCDKRAHKGDAFLYFDPPSITTAPPDWISLANIFNLDVKKYSYSDLLARIYERQEMTPDLILCAHGHYLAYFNNNLITDQRYKIRQVISGGGGGKLMPQKDFSRGDILGLHEQKFGFFRITCNVNRPQFVHIDAYTTDGQHYEFTNVDQKCIDSSTPVDKSDPEAFISVLKPGSY